MNPLHQDRLRLVRWPWLLALLALFLLALVIVKTGGYEAQAREWLNLLVRWLHIIYAVAWIGASFYFIFLENALERQGVRSDLAGNIHTIHGGGVYYLEKYKTAPDPLPRYLHWFKWDAYFTWVTGFLLLVVVYYSDPRAILLAPESTLAPAVAVMIAVGSLAAAWLVYVLLSSTRLLYRPFWFLWVALGLVILTTLGLSQIFSGRGTFMHIGAMLGTIMAGNVFFVIIPSQKALIRALQKGETLDPAFIAWVQLRSRHNNYLTLPVLFTMIAHHFPLTYGHGLNWLILALLFTAGVLTRHFVNVTEKQHHTTLERGGAMPYLLVLAGAALLAAFYLSLPPRTAVNTAVSVEFAEIQSIVERRCAGCHADQPTEPGYASPPAGVALDTPQRIVEHARRIHQTAVETNYMPLGNLTRITPEEREKLGAWYGQGAPGN